MASSLNKFQYGPTNFFYALKIQMINQCQLVKCPWLQYYQLVNNNNLA